MAGNGPPARRAYSYQRLDLLASTLGVATDLAAKSEYMTDEEREGAASDVVASILKNLSNKTWLSGLADAIQALEDPDRYSTRWFARLAGSMVVPAGSAQVARTIDPVLRETKGPLETIRSRVPGLSQSLLPRRDIWGEEIRSEGGLGPDIMSPVWTKTRRNDPLNAEMMRIGAGIGKPSKKVGGVMLSPEDYNAYQAEAGRATRAGLMDLMLAIDHARGTTGGGQVYQGPGAQDDAGGDVRRRAIGL
jgi:hypothetical protein